MSRRRRTFRAPPARRRHVPKFEVLERLSLLSGLPVFTVSNTAAEGDGSFAQAIADANAASGGEIDFSISAGGPQVISTAGCAATSVVFINGASQPNPDNDAGPLIELQAQTSGGVGIELAQGSAGSIISGLYITGFTTAIQIDSADNTVGGTTDTASNVLSGNSVGIAIGGSAATGNLVEGDMIGTDASGTAAHANTNFGIQIYNGASDNTIGGVGAGERNVISGNGNSGVMIQDAGTTANVILGDFIGTDAAGTSALGNAVFGVADYGGPGNTIGGTAAGDGNVISGNSSYGVLLGSATTGNLVAGNLIGTDSTGTSVLSNPGDGIYITGAASFNTIGGTTAAARNVIAGAQYGIEIYGQGETDNLIEGNYIGTNLTGTTSLANGVGVLIGGGAQNNLIGGTSPGAGNLLSGNRYQGIVIQDSGTTGNRIEGDLIGTDASGLGALGNVDYGISIYAGACENTIGGTAPSSGNVIAYSGVVGITVGGNLSGTDTGNSVLGNSIYANTNQGIDLAADGPTPNSPGGPHTGPNDLQNTPLLTAATGNTVTTTIQGSLNSTPNTAFRIEFFASSSYDSSGKAEGETFLGAQSVTTDSSGNVTFTAIVPRSTAAGQIVTATATDPAGNTSEFSPAVTWTSGPDAPGSSGTLHLTGITLNPIQNLTFQGQVASFTDSNSSGSIARDTATIDWGDGTTSLGTITSSPILGNRVIGSHLYSGTGPYTAFVEVFDQNASYAAATDSVAFQAETTPIANNDSYAVAHDRVLRTSASNGLIENDSDADGASLSATLVGGAQHGNLVLHTDGSFTYTPAGGYSGPDSFSYELTDGRLTSDVATVTLDVTESAPVAVNDSYQIGHDRTLTVSSASGVVANDHDADGDALSATLVATVAHGTLTFRADGSFSYVPNDGFSGTDSFSYTLSDGLRTSSVATVTIDVTESAPMASNDAFSVAHDQVLSIPSFMGVLANDSDADTDNLSALPVANPQHGTLSLNPDGSFTYTPATGFSGSDSFSYQATDGLLSSSVATVAISVTESAPAVTDVSFSGPHDEALNSTVGGTDADGDNLTYSEAAAPLHGTLSLSPNGAFTYTPSAGFTGTDSFTFQASDGLRSSNVATAVLDVTESAPVASDLAFATPHDRTLNDSVVASDPDGDRLTYSLSTGPAHGSVSLQADGSFVYNPAPGYAGGDSFTYTVGDGFLTSGPATASIDVTESAPVAESDTYSTAFNTTLTVAAQAGVLANDQDADSDPLTVSLVTDAQHGSLTLNADGSFTYVPSAGYSGPDSFVYRVSDGQLSSNVGTATIDVNNATPFALNDAFSIGHDRSLTTTSFNGVLANDSDPDGDALSAILVSSVRNGALTLNADGSFSYSPAAGFTGTDEFTYEASDGQNSSEPATVVLEVTEAAPVAGNALYSIAHDQTLSTGPYNGVLAHDTDPNGDRLAVAVVTSVQHGSLSLASDGSFTYTPAAGFSGTDSFTYESNDGRLTSQVATVTIDVTESAPVAVGDVFSITENQTLTTSGYTGILANDSDADGDPLTATLVSNVQHGTLVLQADGSFAYTPAAGYVGTDRFIYQDRDGLLSGNLATVIMDVTQSAPVALNDAYSVNAGQTLTTSTMNGVLSNDTDSDGEALSVNLVSTVAHGTVTLNADGTFSYTPTAGYSGTDSFTYDASDGHLSSSVATVIIDVAAGDALTANDDSYTIAHDQTLQTFSYNGLLSNDSDSDGDSLSAALVSDVQHGSLALSADGSFSYTPDPRFSGTDSFSYQASDGTGSSQLATVLLDVTESAPVANSSAVNVGHDRSLYGSVWATDADGDPLNFTAISTPVHGTLVMDASGSFTYSPTPGYSGSDSFTYQVSDGLLTSNVATVAFTVMESAPVAVDLSLSTAHDTPLQGSLPASDADQDALTYTQLSSPQHGTLDFQSDGTYTYTPDAGYSGFDSFGYQVSDGLLTSGPAEVDLNVTETAPVAADDSYAVTYNQTLTEDAFGGVLANDSDLDGDSITAALVSDVQHGTLSLNVDGSFSYTPATGYTGTDSFLYQATDGIGSSNIVQVTIDVSQSTPFAQSDAYSTAHDLSLSTTSWNGVLSNDSNADGAPIQAVLVTNVQHGSLNLNPDGSFDYTPDTGYSGPDGFTYQASDGLLTSSAVDVTIDVTEDEPIARNDLYSMAHDQTLRAGSYGGVLGNDTDTDGDPLTASLVTNVQHGTLTFHADGSFAYVPHPGFSGTDRFTYKDDDGLLTSGVSTVTIDVTESAPVVHAALFTVAHDQTLSVDSYAGVLSNASDADGDTMTVQLVGSVSHGSLTLQPNGSFTYAPASGFSGTDSFTFKVSDGLLTSRVVAATIDVTERAPLAADDLYAIVHDQTLVVSTASGLLANDLDADGDTLIASVVTGVAHGSLSLSPDGSFSYTPAAGFSGTDSFTYQLSDGLLSSNVATVTLGVTGGAPVAISDAYSVGHGRSLTVSAFGGVLSNDVSQDGGSLTATVVSTTNHGTLALSPDGSFTYTPDSGFTGTDTFTYQAGDGPLQSGVVTVTIAVNETAPIAVDDSYSIAHNQPLSTTSATGVLANDKDAEGDSLTGTVVTNPAHGSLTFNADGSFTYTPVTNYVGSDTFTYQASDGILSSGIASVTIAVNEIPPVAMNDSYSGVNGQVLTVPAPGVLANDTDPLGQALFLTVVSPPSHGSLSGPNSDGSFSYTPGAGFFGHDSFTYQASDGVLSSNAATVSLFVSSLSGGTGATINEVAGVGFQGTVATFQDIDSSLTPAQYTATINWGDSQTSTGTVSVSDGLVTVQAAHTYAEAGTYAPTVQVSSTNGSTAIAASSAIITVAKPVAVDGTAVSLIPGVPFQGIVGGFTDPNPLGTSSDFAATIDWGDGTTSAGLVLGAGGTYQVTGSHSYTGPDSSYPLSVTIQDQGGDTVVAHTNAEFSASLHSLVGLSISTSCNAPVSAAVASFVVPPGSPSSTFTATIDWGDGSSSEGSVSASGGSGVYLVSGRHTYTSVGTSYLTVEITDGQGRSFSVASKATVVDSGGENSGSGTNGVTFQAYNMAPSSGLDSNAQVATFNDPNSSDTASSFTATINWGDGTNSVGQVTSDPSGRYDVSGDHSYASSGSYSISVNVSSPSGAGFESEATSDVGEGGVTIDDLTSTLESVANTTPYFTNIPFQGTVATFSDLDTVLGAGNFRATIDWGDGSAVTTGSISGNETQGYVVTSSHTFDNAGLFDVTITVVDSGGNESVEQQEIEVIDPPVFLSMEPPFGVVQSCSNLVLGTVVCSKDESASDLSVTIDWGDGETSGATLVPGPYNSQSIQVKGSHTYANPGYYRITIEVEDSYGDVVTGQTYAADANDIYDWPSPGMVLAANLYSAYFNTDPAQSTLDDTGIASFCDSNRTLATNEFSALIDWGDGTVTTGMIDGNPGYMVVYGDHDYSTLGYHKVQVTIASRDGGYSTISGLVHVISREPDPNGISAQGVNAEATVGQQFNGTVAKFSDGDTSDTAGDFQATIDWGDGNTTPGTVTGSNGTFTVSGTYTYGNSAENIVQVDIQTANGRVTTYSSLRSVFPDLQGEPLTPSESDGKVGGPLGELTNVDPSADDYTAVIDWGDGTVGIGQVNYNGSGSSWVTGGHIYAANGNYTIRIELIRAEYALALPPRLDTSDGLATATIEDQVVVNDAPDLPSSYTSASLLPVGSRAAASGQDVIPSGSRLQVYEGAEYQGEVGSFQCNRDGASAGDFFAKIDWGDGEVSQGEVTTGADGNYEIDGSHLYALRGTYAVFVSVFDTAVTTLSEQAVFDYGPNESVAEFAIESAATVLSQPVAMEDGVEIHATADEPLGGVVLAAGNAYEPYSSLSMCALVDWGDGTKSPQVVQATGGKLSVVGNHTYHTPGLYTTTITVYDGTTAYQAHCTVNVAPNSVVGSSDVSPITASGIVFTVTAGTSFTDTRVATFEDNDPRHIGGYHQVTIDWGDKTTSEGTVEATTNLGEYVVRGSHVYADPGEYNVRITVADQGDAAVASSEANVEASGIVATGSEFMDTAGRYDCIVASFTDANAKDSASSFQATVDLGLGFEPFSGQVIGGDGQFYVVVSDVPDWKDGDPRFTPYSLAVASAAGNRDITVTIRRAESVVATVTSTMVSGEFAADTIVSAPLVLPTENIVDGLFVFVTDWGDGTLPTYPDVATHVYQHEGEYRLTYEMYRVGVGQEGLATGVPVDEGSYTQDVSVSDAPLIPAFTGAGPVNGVLGQSLDDVPLFSFTDPDPTSSVSDYQATVDWGDGTASAGLVELSSQGVYEVHGDHTYDRDGNFTITVLVQDQGGANVVGGRQANIVIDAVGKSFGGFVNVPTGNAVVATFPDPTGDAAADPKVTIDWGDNATSTGNLEYDPALQQYEVLGNHVYGATGTYDVRIRLSEYGLSTDVGCQATIVPDWSLIGGQPTNQPGEAQLTPLGQAEVALNTGGVRIAQPLDFDLSPGTSVGGDPELVYNSDTVNVRPIIQARLQSSADDSTPESIDVQLTWNGVAQDWVSYDASDHNPGDAYSLSAQVQDPVAQSGLYPWSLHVVIAFGDGEPEFNAEVSGTARVVVNDSPSPDPENPFNSIDFFGAGWGLSTLDRLVPNADANGDVLWVAGSGDSEAFTRNDDGTFTSPPEDFGSLVENEDHSFTYTATDQTKYDFDSLGLLTQVTDSDGLETTYEYTDQGQLEQVTTPDGGVTTFSYDPNSLLLDTITEPGGRVVKLGNGDGGVVSGITNPDGSSRTLSYDGDGRLTEDVWGPLNYDGTGSIDELYTYDPYSGAVTNVDDGLGVSYTISAQAAQGLGAAEAPDASQAVATVEDALGDTTTYTLDQEGRPLQEVDADGNTQSWTRDAHGQVTKYTDARSQVTNYAYDYSTDGAGDLTRVSYADGSYVNYGYDTKFHEVTSEQAPGPDGTVAVTTNTYDPDTGDLLTTKDPMGNLTVNTWSDGLLMSTNDQGQTTHYDYDANRRLTEVTDPADSVTTYTYDALGNLATTVDPRNGTTSTTYDDMNRLIAQTNPAGDSSATNYNVLGEPTREVDGKGIATVYVYDDLGDLLSEVDDADSANPVTAIANAFDVAGNLTQTTDGDGNTTTYQYDPDGLKTAESTVTGTTLFQYDADGNVTQTTDPNSNVISYAYDVLNRRTRETDPLGSVVTKYDLAGDVIEVDNADNQATTYQYNLDGEQVGDQNADGGASELYDAYGNVTQSTDADGHVTTYEYDADNRLTRETDPIGATLTLYDADGNVTQVTDPAGNVTTYEYDSDNRVTKETDPIGTTLTFYDADGNVTKTIDPDGNSTQYVYDDFGRQVSEIDPIGTTSTAYDANGNITQITDPNNNTITFAYDAQNRKTQETDGSSVTQWSYDADGNLTEVIDPDWNVTSYQYDAENRVTLETTPDGSTATSYDPAGNVTQTLDPDGHATTYLYDGAGRLTETDAPIGVTKQSYDPDGNLTQTIDPDGRTTTYLYDADGRQTGETDPIGTTQTFYDADGNVTKTIDASNNTTTYAYDGNGRQTAETTASGTTTTHYDNAGNLTEVTDPDGNTTTYQYDQDNRVTLETDPLGSTQTSYDPAGNVTETIDHDGRRIDKTYDTEDRLSTETWYNADGTVQNNLSYTYDDAGNVLTASNDAGTYTFTYDGNNQVLTETLPAGLTLSFGYDPAGNITSITDSTGAVVNSTYDADNRLTSTELTGSVLTALGVSITYDSAGQRQTLTRTSGTTVATTQYSYDGDGRITELKHTNGGGTVVADYGFSYDTGGRLTSETIDGVTTTYSYDGSNQLTGDQVGGGSSQTFNYDANGNRTSAGLGPDNEITSSGPWTYGYDAEGNRTSASNSATGMSWAYTYDDANHLISATETDASHNVVDQETYVYDVYGNRIEQDSTPAGGSTTVARYAYNGTEIWADLDSSGNVTTNYLDGDAVDEVLAREGADGAIAWYLTDQLGSVRDLLDNTGTVQDHIDYDPFGNVTAESAPSFGDRFKFAGMEYDPTTGLDYDKARTYDPGTGTWLSQDPMGFDAGDSNLYRYVANDPTDSTDPSGLMGLREYAGAAWNRVAGATSYVKDKTLALAVDAGQQISVIAQQGYDAVRREVEQLPATLSSLPDALTESMRSGAAIDSVKGYTDNSRLVDVLMHVTTPGYDFLPLPKGPIFGNQAAYEAGATQVAPVADRAAQEAVLMYGLGALSRLGCVLRSGSYGRLAVGAGRVIRAGEIGLEVNRGVVAGQGMIEGIREGDGLKVVTNAISLGASVFDVARSFLGSCFAAGTPLLTPEGDKPIEEFRVGDLLLSRSEHDPEGPLEPKRVEEVFVRTGSILDLHVGSQVIRTTAEHPFWVQGRGWVACSRIQVGDELLGHDGRWLPVEKVLESGDYLSVYNLRVEDYHTYFVGSRIQADFVWAHNTDCARRPGKAESDAKQAMDYEDALLSSHEREFYAQQPGLQERYNRPIYYPNSPTKADRRELGAKPGEVVDHDPPLVKRWYDGDPNIGEPPGRLMTAQERAVSAADRSRMGLQSAVDSARQGRDMQVWSQKRAEELGL